MKVEKAGNVQKVTLDAVPVLTDGRTYCLYLDANVAAIDARAVPVDDSNPNVKLYLAPPGSVMIPLRFVVEALGATVEWKAETQTIIIRL